MSEQSTMMKDHITIKGQDGAFGAYIARPKSLPAPAIVVLQELFGVNADIRATCDELAAQGYIAVAPDLFWRQEPGVDLDVTSEKDWDHGLQLYQAFDREYRTSRGACPGSLRRTAGWRGHACSSGCGSSSARSSPR